MQLQYLRLDMREEFSQAGIEISPVGDLDSVKGKRIDRLVSPGESLIEVLEGSISVSNCSSAVDTCYSIKTVETWQKSAATRWYRNE